MADDNKKPRLFSRSWFGPGTLKPDASFKEKLSYAFEHPFEINLKRALAVGLRRGVQVAGTLTLGNALLGLGGIALAGADKIPVIGEYLSQHISPVMKDLSSSIFRNITLPQMETSLSDIGNSIEGAYNSQNVVDVRKALAEFIEP